MSVGKSQALYAWEGGRLGATALAAVGGVRVDLPQHPVALHGVMTRSSRQLSSTLQVRDEHFLISFKIIVFNLYRQVINRR